MKAKKLLALVLAMVMALGMLTACGGGGGGSSLDMGEIRGLIASEGYDVDVSSSSELNSAAAKVATYLESKNDFTTETANAYLDSIKNYPVITGTVQG